MTTIVLEPPPCGLINAKFVVIGEPASKARARFSAKGGKVRTWTPEETKVAERQMEAAYRASVTNYSPPTDPEAAFGVVAHFYCGTGQRRDVDNMLKLIGDALNKVVWVDDNQIVLMSGQKSRVSKEEARTEVVIYQLGEMSRPKANCEQCGESYNTYASWEDKRFCSQPCHIEWRRERRARTCQECGTEFESHHPDNEKRQYCSIPCWSKAKRVEVACAECGKEFTKPRSLNRAGQSYCTDECRATHWREQRKTAAKGTCADCAGPTSKKTAIRCRPCSYLAKRGNPTITITSEDPA